MPFKDPQRKKDYMKKYRKQYDQKNKEKIKKRKKEYYQANKEDITIKHWKYQGIIFSDYHLLYDIYINTEFCDFCKVKFSEDTKRSNNTRCLDHDHSITDCENVRNILCISCNTKRC